MVVRKANGATASLGQMSTETAGYDRELSHGSDAAVRIDGTLITRSSNTITDAIPGVTLNLLAAAPGSPANITVASDTTSMGERREVAGLRVQRGGRVREVSDRGNRSTSVQRQPAGIVAFARQHPAGRRSRVNGAFKNLNQVGVSIDKNGVFSVDADALTKALSTNPTDVKALFARTATTSSGLTYMSDTAKTVSGTYAVNVTTAATQATSWAWASQGRTSIPERPIRFLSSTATR